MSIFRLLCIILVMGHFGVMGSRAEDPTEVVIVFNFETANPHKKQEVEFRIVTSAGAVERYHLGEAHQKQPLFEARLSFLENGNLDSDSTNPKHVFFARRPPRTKRGFRWDMKWSVSEQVWGSREFELLWPQVLRQFYRFDEGRRTMKFEIPNLIVVTPATAALANRREKSFLTPFVSAMVFGFESALRDASPGERAIVVIEVGTDPQIKRMVSILKRLAGIPQVDDEKELPNSEQGLWILPGEEDPLSLGGATSLPYGADDEDNLRAWTLQAWQMLYNLMGGGTKHQPWIPQAVDYRALEKLICDKKDDKKPYRITIGVKQLQAIRGVFLERRAALITGNFNEHSDFMSEIYRRVARLLRQNSGSCEDGFGKPKGSE